jgi:hypothetical protein
MKILLSVSHTVCLERIVILNLRFVGDHPEVKDILPVPATPGAIQIGVLTDSLLSQAQFGLVRHLKPGRENTRVTANVRHALFGYQKKIQVKQFSYTGLKAFATERDGDFDRDAVFLQMEKEYPIEAERPKLWFSIIGINDFKSVDERDVARNPKSVLEKFLRFFNRVRSFSPNSRIRWLGIGNVWSQNRNHRAMTIFRDYLLEDAELPEWLEFEDVGEDCTDDDVKDETGHWVDSYIKTVAERVVERLKEVADKKQDVARTNGEYLKYSVPAITGANLLFQFVPCSFRSWYSRSKIALPLVSRMSSF